MVPTPEQPDELTVTDAARHTLGASFGWRSRTTASPTARTSGRRTDPRAGEARPWLRLALSRAWTRSSRPAGGRLLPRTPSAYKVLK